VTEHPAPPLRTWRPMAAWTGAILLALGLAWFGGAVVVTQVQVRAALKVFCGRNYSEAIGRLGGPAQAATKLSQYLGFPGALAPDKNDALLLLALCDEPGSVAMVEVLRNRDPILRREACIYLVAILDVNARLPKIASDPRIAVPALTCALTDSDAQVRSSAAFALGTHGAKARAAIPALEQALRDENEEARKAAAKALKQIRDKEPPK